MESLQTAFEDNTTNDTAAEHLLRPLYFVYLVLHLLIQLLNEPWTNQPAPDDCRVADAVPQQQQGEHAGVHRRDQRTLLGQDLYEMYSDRAA